MTREEYRQHVLRTLNPAADYTKESRLTLAALGLAGESGEVVDLIKKHLFHGKPLDRDKIILELGDVRWYLESFAWVLGVGMEEIEERNIAKLKARFPDGFTNKDANAKAGETKPLCSLCGEPMPEGETMFKYHGYSGPCPKVPPAPEGPL